MRQAYTALFALAAAWALGATGASAQGMDSNVRCLLVSNAFSNGAKDAKAKSLANAAKLFYGGRVSALPQSQIQAGLTAQRQQITAANAGQIMAACAQAMDRALKSIQAAGQAVSQPKR